MAFVSSFDEGTVSRASTAATPAKRSSERTAFDCIRENTRLYASVSTTTNASWGISLESNRINEASSRDARLLARWRRMDVEYSTFPGADDESILSAEDIFLSLLLKLNI